MLPPTFTKKPLFSFFSFYIFYCKQVQHTSGYNRNKIDSKIFKSWKYIQSVKVQN